MTQRRVTAYLDHASVSPTFSEAQTTCKSELLAPTVLKYPVRWEETRMSHLPRRYWKNPVTRFRDVVFFTAMSLKWAIVHPAFPLSVCVLHEWYCAHVIQGGKPDQLSFISSGKQELSVWKHSATECWKMEPPPPPVVSLSLSLLRCG